MPAQWLGNSVRKAARANGVGGFVSALVTADGQTNWGDYVNVATPEPTMVFDSLESALFDNPTGPAPAKNTIGFDYPGQYNVSVSITRNDGFIVANKQGAIEPPLGPFPEKEIEAAPGSDGQHSMRFRYSAGGNQTELGYEWTNYLTEVWMSYWIKVPINYLHGSLNNKFFAIFPTRATYDQAGTLTIQTRPDGSGGAVLRYQDGGVTVGETGTVPFISVPSDRGRWMHVVMRFKRASTSTANDGAYQFWRRWQDEAAYTLMHSKLNAQLYNNTDPNGFRKGFIFGWANDAYASDTEWYLDKMQVSDQPLVPAGTEGL